MITSTDCITADKNSLIKKCPFAHLLAYGVFANILRLYVRQKCVCMCVWHITAVDCVWLSPVWAATWFFPLSSDLLLIVYIVFVIPHTMWQCFTTSVFSYHICSTPDSKPLMRTYVRCVWQWNNVRFLETRSASLPTVRTDTASMTWSERGGFFSYCYVVSSGCSFYQLTKAANELNQMLSCMHRGFS